MTTRNPTATAWRDAHIPAAPCRGDVTRLVDASRALLDWARENTGPRDPASPHALLVALQAALAAVSDDLA